LSIASANHSTQYAAPGTSTVVVSPIGLPASSVSSSASSSRCVRISAAQRSSTALRARGFSPAHTPASNARRAAATAAFTSASPQSATFASTRPSIGLTQSNVLPPCASRDAPSMNARPSIGRRRLVLPVSQSQLVHQDFSLFGIRAAARRATATLPAANAVMRGQKVAGELADTTSQSCSALGLRKRCGKRLSK
jgi:hypothetical protein